MQGLRQREGVPVHQIPSQLPGPIPASKTTDVTPQAHRGPSPAPPPFGTAHPINPLFHEQTPAASPATSLTFSPLASPAPRATPMGYTPRSVPFPDASPPSPPLSRAPEAPEGAAGDLSPDPSPPSKAPESDPISEAPSNALADPQRRLSTQGSLKVPPLPSLLHISRDAEPHRLGRVSESGGFSPSATSPFDSNGKTLSAFSFAQLVEQTMLY